jgi:hypothetical protein
MDFVIIQRINFATERYIFVVEAKRDALENGLSQLLLALTCMWDVNNDNKMVYGFLTTAINWQLVTYDGQTCKLSKPSTVFLANMKKQEDRWLKNNTQILDVIDNIYSHQHKLFFFVIILLKNNKELPHKVLFLKQLFLIN